MVTLPEVSVKVVKRSFDKRFKLAKLCTDLPPVGKIVDKMLFDGDDIMILPRDKAAVKSIDVNIEVDGPKNTVLPSDVVKEMIKRSEYRFLMDFCICRTSNKCENYPRDFGCLFLGKGAARITTKVGHLVSEEEAIAHVDRCGELGLVNLIGRNKIDSVWLNTGPKEDLLSICACCQCCCLWKMLPDLPESISSSITKMPGVTIGIDIEKCIGCGRCVSSKICFIDAISVVDGKATIDDSRCKGCGRCAEFCEQNVFSVAFDESCVTDSLDRIAPLVNL